MANRKTLTESERKRLQKEHEETQAELDRLREYLQSEPETTGDEVDLAVYEREKNLALVQRLKQKIEEIDYALESAKKGVFGICQRCGNPIDPERLMAVPETRLCIKCKSVLERVARRASQR